jgi:precorrin-6B methylase 2
MGILGALGMVPVSSPRITVLGMGMGATPLAWLQEHPESMVTTVDINSKIVQMSKILIPQLTVFEEVGSLHMRVGDARHTVRSVRDQDILVVDVYGSAAPPPHVTTVEFFKEIKAALVPDGVVVVNTISKTRGPLSDRLYATMATMRAAGFKDLVCFAMRDLNEHGVPRSLDDHDGRPFNVIIMATPHPAVPTSWIFADGTDIGDTAQRIWDGAWQARHHSFWTAQQGVVCSDGGMTADMFDE